MMQKSYQNKINQMGIGRRKFFEYISAALVGLTIHPLKAIAINSDNYVNKKFGILLTKPSNWDFEVFSYDTNDEH